MDAALSQPTNGRWRLASLLVSLLSTNDARTLLSVNEPQSTSWSQALDGILVLTNTVTDDELAADPYIPPQFDTLLMQSNSPQATTLATAINAARSNQPNRRFEQAGDI